MTRTLAELIAGLKERAALELRRGSRSMAITAIVEDSRLAIPGCLFIARSGTQEDGRRFIADAVARGAAAVLSDDAAIVPDQPAWLVADDVPQAAASVAEAFYQRPSEQLKLVGVTGTNGKTTTAHLVHQFLQTQRSGSCGLIGTVQIDDGRATAPATLTTPPAIEISRLLRVMVDSGCGACAMEVSSHALQQKRAAGLSFDIGIFTNLSGDHLDYHGTMEEYAAAKAMLFQSLPESGAAVVNADDPHWADMVRQCPARIIRCSLDDLSQECFADVRDESAKGITGTFRGPWGSIDGTVPLIGRHNAMNALQAAAACFALGMSKRDIERALAHCEAPPGRLEPVTGSDDPFGVYVDYAHTDDALENVLRAVRPLVQSPGKLRVVFGCGGDRDRTKRPRMAQAAWRWADDVIITSDNPRTEDPDAIICEIADGVPVESIDKTTCITDRREAIVELIQRAKPGDLLVIAGKGHEDYQIIGTEKRPFDDRRIAAEALVSIRAQNAAHAESSQREAARQ